MYAQVLEFKMFSMPFMSLAILLMSLDLRVTPVFYLVSFMMST